MRIKRWLCLMLIAALMALPAEAMAASKPSVKLSTKVGLMSVGSTAALKPTVKHFSKDDLTYESSDASVAAVTVDGKIEALNPGKAVVTVYAGTAKAQCGIVVLPVSLSLAVGEKASLPYGKVEKYKSKNSKVASVSKKGVVTGKKAGVTTITVTYKKQKVKVEVSVTSGAAGGTGGEIAAPAGSKVAGLDAAGQTDQIVLVEHTGGSKATLSVHEKVDGVWKQLLSTQAYVGKNGIGKTKEGDKKTPVGTYNLNTPFGIKDDPGAQMPYTKVTKYHYWCGSSSSEYYNQLVDSRETGRSYTSSDEHLIDYKGAYNYCLFIDYNAEGKPGLGSCIFLHCFSSKKYTAGCVAISETNMKKIVQWARAGAKIVIKAAD